MKRPLKLLIAAASLMTALGCSESNRNTSPVELRATASEKNNLIDLATGFSGADIADILLVALSKRTDSNPLLMDVKLRSYRVSYIRTDGGRTVPASFVVSVNQLIPVDGAATPLDNFVAVDPTARNLAPFASLLPQNGGVDPETGRRVVEMDARVEVFGETLSGEDVYAVTRFPMTFCYGCS